MKQKELFYSVLTFVLLLLAAGCQQPEFDWRPEVASNVLMASLESEVATKTHIESPVDGIYYPYWTANDALAVYVDGLNIPDLYRLSAGAGTDKGTFSGVVRGSRYVALYPYEDRVEDGLQGNVLHLSLPAEQVYLEGSFGEGAFPMLAVNEGNALSFLNLCSVLKISMTGEAMVRSIRFTAKDSKMSVSGKATVRTDFASKPELTMESGGSSSVLLQCTSIQLDADHPTDFFLVIPPGTYKGGFTLEVDTFSGKYTKKISSDVTFERSQFRYIAPFVCETSGEIDSDNLPYNQIWYQTSDNRKYNPSEDYFDRSIVTHTYTDGKGVIVFDGILTRVGGFSNSRITEIHFPNSVTEMDYGTLRNASITSFHVPDNVSKVGNYVLQNCSKLTRIYGIRATSDEKAILLEDGSLVAYAPGAIKRNLTIPEGVTSLGPFLFVDNDVLAQLTLPAGLKSIANNCFIRCTALETVSLPASLESVENYSFSSCDKLRKFLGDCPLSPDGQALIGKGGMIVCWAGVGIKDYSVPEQVSQIGPEAFRNKKDLRSLTFTSELTNMYSGCFSGSDKLEFFYGIGGQISSDHHCMVFYGDYLVAVTAICPPNYKVPDNMGIQRIFYSAFQGNTSIKKLAIPDAVHTAYSFENMSNLEVLRLSESLNTLGSNAFAGCSKLDSIYFRSSIPPSYEEYEANFFGHEGLVICVPEGSEDRYKSSTSWSKYAQYIKGVKYDDIGTQDYYISNDYSQDGKVDLLQRSSQGAGIDLVLMGDAFSDRQLADGTYDGVIHRMMEAFFNEEPYKSYRDLFNVYQVKVVSGTEGYEHGGQALGGWFGDGTLVGGNDSKCMDYARNAISDDRMENVLIIVAMNSPNYGGTCYMYNPSDGTSDYGCGTSVAYFPIGESADTFASLVHHEAGGHGFAKLADEYAYEDNGTIPDSEIEARQAMVPRGWWKNADFTNDPDLVKWSKFLKDSRYQYDGLGVFEGAFTYWKGAWRPTEYSIMRYNTGGFNAPSREAIWYRMHKLAFGDSWEYDYEAFVAYDALNRKTSTSGSAWAPRSMPKPTHPPVVVGKTWREAIDHSNTE